MCDSCSDFIQLLTSYENKFSKGINEQPNISKKVVDIVNEYVQSWSTRQCMCCYRDTKNLERFSYLTQGLIYLGVCQCKVLSEKGSESTATTSDPETELENDEIEYLDKLLLLIARIFLLNFPLYDAFKHTVQVKIDELSQQELQSLNLFCDLHDPEIPIYLLKNVSWFCKIGGLLAMTSCFTMLTPKLLPVSTAHAMISVVCNLKLWMNYKSLVTMLVPLRSCVLRYMCKLSDRDLRTPTIKSMADFMWNAIKDPLDTPVAFDVDGLDLAFKYFTSSTLTMRLAGITHINNQIGVLAEVCVGESLPEAEAAPRHMADWLITNNIITHIFGPNLHVEVIKQSHIILNFLAMEGRITCEHMDMIWAAAQLKHCAKPVHDLLPGLVKHLAAAPTLHLYGLLTKLEPKEHTEQTLYLASALIKSVWSRSGSTTAHDVGLMNLAASNSGINSHKCTTSSENSVSLEPSNSEDEHVETSGQSNSEDIDGVEIGDQVHVTADSVTPPPCKLLRKHSRSDGNCAGSSSDPEIDGIPLNVIKCGISEKTKRSLVAKAKSGKRQIINQRKKAIIGINVLPECNEHGSSSSQDEADEEEEEDNIKIRKRRHINRKSQAKRRKANPNRLSNLPDIEPKWLSDENVDSENEVKSTTKDSKAALIVPNEAINNDVQSQLMAILDEVEPEIEGDGEGSYSSRMSNKSEKNMSDFDGEDSVCEEELVQLAVHVQMNVRPHSSPEKSPIHVDPCISSTFKVESVCQPGNTLLWDLLQDDKICQLGEGLAVEAEKTLCNLICYIPDKEIRMKFIEGCLKNLENNNSVIVSLRMLPKLLTSFRGLDMHQVTHWAERQHHMMRHFFNNLKTYTENQNTSLPLYTHLMQVQVRLQFLSALFSPVVSPTSFKLSIEQVDTLWECLAHDTECSDELFSWLLSQTKTTELHALKVDALRRLYVHHLPSLPPEKFSMTCLGLFQHLCSLNHCLLNGDDDDGPSQNTGMDHMWKIALRATNTDVSMAAIQYINSYYMGHNLQNEGQFVRQCMTHLKAATEDLNSSNGMGCEEPPLLCIQRALLLMKSHIDTFRRRYAFHLRKWTLDGKGISSHSATLGDRSTAPIRLVIQYGSTSEKCFLDLLTTDYIADLRAEIVKWCESIAVMKNQDESPNKPGETWIRLITQGQELTLDCDERMLMEMGFKDNQIIFVSVGVSRNMKRREYLDSPSMQPPPPRDMIPTLLLLQPNNFEQLFSLMHILSSMKSQIKGGRHIPHTKAQVLSRRVWDILSLLPTSPTLLKGFQKLDIPLIELLNPSSAQRLMYSLYIIESLSSPVSKDAENSKDSWCRTFIQHGGLRHLFDIFMSGVLQQDGGDGSEWQQDCLAILLKTICHLGMEQWSSEVKHRNDKIIIPNLNEEMIAMMDIKSTMRQLTGILEEASMPNDLNQYRTGFWGRAQVVHYAMALLVSWLHSSEDAQDALFKSPNFDKWLKRLVLEDPEPSVRREACSAIYKLCLGMSASSRAPDNNLVAPTLSQLLLYLDIAENMKTPKNELQVTEDGKEPYGPACRDYFWLISRLVDSLPNDVVRESLEDPSNCLIDINTLTNKVATSLMARDYLETRHRTIDDDGLIGLLNLLTNLIKYKPPFQRSKAGQILIHEIFDFLFALPTPKKRHVPKCKSPRSRTAAFDLLVEFVKGSPENYAILHAKLLKQHQPGPNSPYPWDYWPHEDGRSECGYVGLTNLGATCYMASCMQHLYMMPQTRASILAASTEKSKHENTLKELQRMFAYLLESERKAYNPRSFCKVYTMDHQPLNTAEQKDMAEFFIDLVSKLEEMTPELKSIIKSLFCGIISNNVVSLDCDHVSCTLEEFYTVRCQVADMRNLYESLDEVTVKDTLEGDNMYTCSHCQKKVRAEKRACFKKLPKILCFNTMRYTFNMLTMLKEKVNTHFSFPMRLNMAGYTEKELMPQQYQDEREKLSDLDVEQYEYDLIGVTVHTGTADGGHYYSFIKDRSAISRDKWFLFNDAEVKPFDPNQIAAECFGGEMTSKTYDSVTDKFMDFSFEKTNSAYMLFYEQCPVVAPGDNVEIASTAFDSEHVYNSNRPATPIALPIELSKELEDWIWQDNMHFIQDKNIFEHTYFNFMWQICGYIPQTILPIQPNITQKAAELTTSFFIETFIHAKEKPTMVQWVELVTKQFNSCQEACVWFLDHMAQDTWWPVQVMLKCPNQMVRQMFQRLCIHVIQRLKSSQGSSLYLQIDDDVQIEKNCPREKIFVDPVKIGNQSCVTKFVKTLLSLMEHGAKAHLKHLTEYFGFFYEFSKMGEEESKFLLIVGAINSMVNFYLGQKVNDFVDVSEEEEEEMIALPTDKYKPASLDKMITLIASLVEKSRDSNNKLQLSEKDYCAIAGGKGFPFLYQQIKDNINLQQTKNLIHSLCKNNSSLAVGIVCMISQAITRHSEACQPFFKILTLLTENSIQSGGSGASSSQPCFTQLVLQKVWEAADCCPYTALDWLSLQVTRNRLVHQWVLNSMDSWLERFLIANNNQRVRNAAAYLLVSLVPSNPFRQGFRATHRLHRDCHLSTEAQAVLHQVYTALLQLLSTAKHYTDMQQHGTTKLTTFFALMVYCCVSRTEKLMFGQYFLQLWHLFHPKLSEPSIPSYHNKQALLAFWNHVCTDCPENVQLMLQNGHVTKNIAFNYILADHDDQDIIMYNRAMLPAYYGILRLMCQQSRVFTRLLASHQNLQWAFKNITPHPTQYPQAVDELFKLMQLMVIVHADASDAEKREICSFRRTTLVTYLQCLDGRTSWSTLITAFKILIENEDDKMYVVFNRGIQIVFESFQNLHVMLHEATACHISSDMIDILTILLDLLKCLNNSKEIKDLRGLIGKDWIEVLSKLATLLNTYNPPEIRNLSIECLIEISFLMAPESVQVLVPLLSHCHTAFQTSHDAAVPLGSYFPKRSSSPIIIGKGSTRPMRPMVQMTVPHNQLECSRGIYKEYDQALDDFYGPYHNFIDVLIRIAINHNTVTDTLINLSAVIGFEAVPLHSLYFPKLWLEIAKNSPDKEKYISALVMNNYFEDYIESMVLDERLALNIDLIYDFVAMLLPKVKQKVFSKQNLLMIENTVVSLSDQLISLDLMSEAKRLIGDLRALILVYNCAEIKPPVLLRDVLTQLEEMVAEALEQLEPKVNNDSKKEEEPSTSKKDSIESASKVQNQLDFLHNHRSGKTKDKKEPPRTLLDDIRLLNLVISELLIIVNKKL